MGILSHVGTGPGVWVTLALLVGAIGVAVMRRSVPLLVATAGAGIGFQVLHFAEHLLQAGYWVLHPSEAPWLTPWAEAGRDGLASLTDGQAGTGNEVLHLLGNGIFLVGLIAALAAVAAWPGMSRAGHGRRQLRLATWLQAGHVGEHVLLTVTWLGFGEAHGLSTLLGILEPGTALAGGMRVWFHFLLNLAATSVAASGAWSIYQSERPTRVEVGTHAHSR